ncbi:hypothetical protein TNCV_1828681 [Trichonephila clavipes]|nr:hypothetical protein TNCV_1828681 [Trichonephila clavipes]
MTFLERYVMIENQEIRVEESFINFNEPKNKTAEDISHMILSKLKADELDIMNCRGQAYDKAATMAGCHTDAQQQIKDINPNAEFLPCSNYSPNLVCIHAPSVEPFEIPVLFSREFPERSIIRGNTKSRENLEFPENLGKKPYACCQVIYSQFGLAIHQNDHQARRRFVEWAKNEIAVVPDFHKRILFSDEAHFWLNGYVNKQNCRIWSEANPQVYVETPLHPEKTDCLVRFMGWWNPSSKTMKATTLQSMVIGIEP